MPELDPQTRKVLTDSEKMADLVRNEGWVLAKKKLIEMLISLDSVDAMELDKDPSQVIIDIKARKAAIALVRNWILDIEGTANQNEANQESFTRIRTEQIISYHE